jgi:KDO2-lipid IV(A) lauroyltransferase
MISDLIHNTLCNIFGSFFLFPASVPFFRAGEPLFQTADVFKFLYFLLKEKCNFAAKILFLVKLISYIIYICEPAVKFFLYCTLYYISGYRKKVVSEILARSFPVLSYIEFKKLRKKFYRNFTDVLVENAIIYSINKDSLYKRIKVLNPELFQQMADENISALCIGGHVANWEWGGMAIGNASPMHNVAVYLPLKNKYVDGIMRNTRSKLTKLDTLVPSRDIFKALLRAPRPFQTYIIADQSPSREHHHRVTFLGQSTAFFNGPAKMVKKLKLGMVYVETRRTKPGYYEVELKLMFKDGSILEEEQITSLYAKHLEDTILKKPSDWLWSHKRWKF